MSYNDFMVKKKSIKPNKLYKSNGKSELSEINVKDVSHNGLRFEHVLNDNFQKEQQLFQHELEKETYKMLLENFLLENGIDIEKETLGMIELIEKLNSLQIINKNKEYISLDLDGIKIKDFTNIYGTIVEKVNEYDLGYGVYDYDRHSNKVQVNLERKHRFINDL